LRRRPSGLFDACDSTSFFPSIWNGGILMQSNEPAIPAPEEDVDAPEPLGAGINFTDPNSPLAPYYMTTAGVFGVLLIALSVTFFGYLRLWHSDIWGHARFGEWMMEHQRLPDQEPFTPYSDKTQKPLHTQWLSQSIYGAIIQFSEWIGRGDATPERTLARTGEMLRGLHLLLILAQFIFAWLAYQRVSGSAAWANLSFLLTWFLMITYLSVQRPQAYGLLGMSILLFSLSRFELSRTSVIGLPVLFAFWANLHGSFVVGLAVFFLITGSRVVSSWRGARPESWRQLFSRTDLRRLLAAFILSVIAAGLCNPHGPRIYFEVATFSSRPNITLVDEWRPLELEGKAGYRYIGLAVVTLLLWVGSGFQGTFRLLACLPFALWPFAQQRGMVWWVTLFPWLVAFWAPLCWARLVSWKLPAMPSFRKTILAGSIVLLALIWQRPTQALLNGKKLRPADEIYSFGTPLKLGLELRSDAGNQGRWYPKFAEVLRQNYPDGRFRGGIFASEVQGDYLLRVAPEGCPVLLYSHIHFFSPEHCVGCLNTKFAGGDWRAFLADRQVNLIVVQPDYCDALAALLRNDPEWEVIEDEGDARGRQAGDCLFIALRKSPL
jgi:hypothetical protein